MAIRKATYSSELVLKDVAAGSRDVTKSQRFEPKRTFQYNALRGPIAQPVRAPAF